MVDNEIATSWSQLALVAASSTAMLLGVIIYVRLAGLRSFSKMSSFDFVVTVAFGSLLAATTMSGSSLLNGLFAAATLLALQVVISLGRSRYGLGKLVDNDPIVLAANGEFFHDNLRRCRVTTNDIRAKLREANVLNWDQVRAVVLESTGDISVLHGDAHLDSDIVVDVRDAKRIDGVRGPR